MNYKEYDEVKKQIIMDKEIEEQEEVIDAFYRVRDGRNVSLNDLQTVQKVLSESSVGSSKERVHNFKDTISVLEHRTVQSKEKASLQRKKLKRRGMDMDKIRRQRRLEQEKLRKGKEMDRV